MVWFAGVTPDLPELASLWHLLSICSSVWMGQVGGAATAANTAVVATEPTEAML